MTDSDPGTTRRGFNRVAEQGSGAAQPAVEKATQDSSRDDRAGHPAGGRQTGRQGSAAPAKAGPRRRPRKAQLRLVQLDAWSVMKTAFLLSIAFGIVTIVAVAIVWSVLGAAGVWDSLNSTVQTVMGNDFRVQDYIGTGRVLGFTMLVSAVDVVLLTAIATLGAFLYNLAATLLGGIEVTLAEDN
jgi:Transmembrane domain of unknown function (DUF3566)